MGYRIVYRTVIIKDSILYYERWRFIKQYAAFCELKDGISENKLFKKYLSPYFERVIEIYSVFTLLKVLRVRILYLILVMILFLLIFYLFILDIPIIYDIFW